MDSDFFEELEQSLVADKTVIVRGGLEAFQLILAKFDQAADAKLQDYDRCNFADPAEAIRIQTFRWMVKKEIPRIMENIMNVNTPDTRPWKFTTWLNNFVTLVTGRKA